MNTVVPMAQPAKVVSLASADMPCSQFWLGGTPYHISALVRVLEITEQMRTTEEGRRGLRALIDATRVSRIPADMAEAFPPDCPLVTDRVLGMYGVIFAPYFYRESDVSATVTPIEDAVDGIDFGSKGDREMIRIMLDDTPDLPEQLLR